MLLQRHYVSKKKLAQPTYVSCSMLPFSETYRPSKNYSNMSAIHLASVVVLFVRTFRISLFRTLQICWISAALCETFSRELPDNCSSSFWVFDVSTSTPGCMTTLRTIFSPMKFLYIQSAFGPHFSIQCSAPPNPNRDFPTYRISTSYKPVSL